jgi:hypothetical protein
MHTSQLICHNCSCVKRVLEAHAVSPESFKSRSRGYWKYFLTLSWIYTNNREKQVSFRQFSRSEQSLNKLCAHSCTEFYPNRTENIVKPSKVSNTSLSESLLSLKEFSLHSLVDRLYQILQKSFDKFEKVGVEIHLRL